MRLLIIFLFVSIFSFGQGGGKVDALKFRGKVTTAVRNTIDVPTGEFWLIYNTTTEALEVSDETDTWSNLGSLSTPNINFDGYTLAERNNLDVPNGEFWLIYNTTSDLLEISDSTENWQSVGDGIQQGQNTIPSGISLNQAITNKIEIIPASAGLFGANPAIRIVAGNQDDAVFFVMYDDVVSWSFASGSQEYTINPAGETSPNNIVRKSYVDAAIAAIPSGGSIPDNAVTTAKIANGTILEEDLSTAVVTKLNATGGGISWSTPINSNVVPSTDDTYDIGTEGNRIRSLYVTNTISNSLDAGQVETNLLRLVQSGGGGFRDVRNLNGTLQFQNSTGVWTDFESSSGMTAAQITLEANRALPPLRAVLPETQSLSRNFLTVSAGTEIGRRTYRSASITSNLTLQSNFLVDDIVLMETIGTGQINLIPPSNESFLINGVPTAAGVTLTGNYALHSARKVAASLWEVSSDDVVAFAPAPSNLYQESSGANGTNNAALLGSWVPQSGGSGVVVTDAAAVGGRAIRSDKNGVNNNFGGLNLDMGSNAIVSTWSGGLITTGLELGATYTLTVDLKMSSAGNSPYYAFRFNSSNISEGFITGLNATTYTTRSFQLVIPATGTHQIGNGFRLLPNTNGGQAGTLDIANIRITRNP